MSAAGIRPPCRAVRPMGCPPETAEGSAPSQFRKRSFAPEVAVHRSLAVVPLILLSAGCGSSSGESSSDCNLLLRIDGEVYRSAGLVPADARPLGRADFAACSDGGDSPRGAYFPSDPEQVDTWVIEGHDPGGSSASGRATAPTRSSWRRASTAKRSWTGSPRERPASWLTNRSGESRPVSAVDRWCVHRHARHAHGEGEPTNSQTAWPHPRMAIPALTQSDAGLSTPDRSSRQARRASTALRPPHW